ncbi:MAG: heavy-metal-associated domain-containing protein [Candidatus Dormibacteraeota bacterium]|nr:heavy-metal-associated domain-containing protein [Candidatus Dormibacteraeota bacterium]
MSSNGSRPVAYVRHRSHGRVRASLEKSERSPARMEQIKQRIESHPGIRSVEVNPTTGSVLVTGDHNDQIHQALNSALVLVESLRNGEPSEKAVETVVGAVKAADARVLEATGGTISLKWLVPASFIALGARQLLAQGLTIGSVPWYVLIYYGVDSFLKLNPEHAPGGDSELDRSGEAPSPDLG